MSVLVIPPSSGAPGSITGAMIANGTITNSNIAAGTITGGSGGNIGSQVVSSSNLAFNVLPNRNLLTNPEFRFAQLYDPTSFTPPDNTVGFDAWKQINGDGGATALSLVRVVNTGAYFNAGQYFAEYKQTAAGGGKIMVFQALESALSLALQSLDVCFSIDMYLASGLNIKYWMAILLYNGTADVLTNPVSTWNSNTNNPTLAANWSYLQTFKVSVPIGFSNWGIAVTVPKVNAASFKNIAVAMFSDSAFASNQVMNLSCARLNTGNFFRLYEPLTYEEDLARAQRFIEKSYAIDTVPGSATAANQLITGPLVSSKIYPPVPLQRKVAAPTVTLYSPKSGSSGNWYNVTGTADSVATAPGSNGVVSDNLFVANSALASNNVVAGHWVANASL